MIDEVDRSLADWLGRVLPPRTGVRFDQPSPAWLEPSPAESFVAACLHDVRRDDNGRGSWWTEVRDAEGRVVGRQPAVQRYRLSYLVTAWPAATRHKGGTADGGPSAPVLAEHGLLGSVLKACATAEVLPAECLVGGLGKAEVAVAVHCAPEGIDVATSHLWAGWDLAPRAHLDLVVVAPLVPPMVTDLAPLARELVLDTEQYGNGNT